MKSTWACSAETGIRISVSWKHRPWHPYFIPGKFLWLVAIRSGTDMSKAYTALPEDMRGWLCGRNVIHTGKPYGVAHAPPEDTQFKGSIKMDRGNAEADRETVHPAVCRHPETGEPILFINPTYTSRFQDVSRTGKRGGLWRICIHTASRPEFSCRFRWSPGTIAIWDQSIYAALRSQ